MTQYIKKILKNNRLYQISFTIGMTAWSILSTLGWLIMWFALLQSQPVQDHSIPAPPFLGVILCCLLTSVIGIPFILIFFAPNAIAQGKSHSHRVFCICLWAYFLMIIPFVGLPLWIWAWIASLAADTGKAANPAEMVS